VVERGTKNKTKSSMERTNSVFVINARIMAASFYLLCCCV
jgi:hypothetical protein